jgi:hypothetical protein
MGRTRGHAVASAARAKAPAFAGERNKTIGAAARTPKACKAMREHAAANESLKFALHEQGGAALVLTSIELREEGLEVLADDAVEDPLLGRATHVRPRNRLARKPCREAPRLQDAIKTRAVVVPRVFNVFQVDGPEAKWRTASD